MFLKAVFPGKYIQGEGVITGRNADGYTVSANGAEYVGRNLLVATGSVPILPPIPGLKESVERGYALTNREILSLAEVPTALTVIGGIAEKLDPARFVRVHRSHIVNLDQVASIEPLDTGDARVPMKDGSNLPCSRTYRGGLQLRYGADA